MYEESLRIRRKAFGNEHPAVAESLNNLAQLLKTQVRPAGFCCSAETNADTSGCRANSVKLSRFTDKRW